LRLTQALPADGESTFKNHIQQTNRPADQTLLTLRHF